ncbi:MAG: hypothetical protein AAF050_11630 [Cyanobacteria bacterium J06649_5]
MMQTVKGIYRNGKVELLEVPPDITESEVTVTFVCSQASLAEKAPSYENHSKVMSFGMFSNGQEQFTEADFKAAEFHNDNGLNWV